MTDNDYPSLKAIRDNLEQLRPSINRTPVIKYQGQKLLSLLGAGAEVYLKLELFQKTGTFKMRGALTVISSLSPEQLKRGVVAVSRGNHAIAVGAAAQAAGTTAKVIVPKSANKARVELCIASGAEVIKTEDVHEAFQLAKEIEQKEGRFLVHPFEGPLTALGTATCGLEFLEDVPNLDIMLIGVGGGGLIAGMAAAVKQLRPECEVIGVEPFGADTMWRSFQSGKPEGIAEAKTIADSLGAPHAAPYSFGLCKRFVDRIIRVEDDVICEGLYLLFSEGKLAVEPAGAAALAALIGSIGIDTANKKIGVLVCGANIDVESYCLHLRTGEESFNRRAKT